MGLKNVYEQESSLVQDKPSHSRQSTETRGELT